MGGPRTAEPPDTERETVTDNRSAGPLPRKSDSADVTRSKQGALAHSKYKLLASEATEGVEPTWGTLLSRPAMGPQGTRKGRIRRRRGTKPCSARSLREETTEARTRQGDPPNGCAHLTSAFAKGGKEGGDPPTSSVRTPHTAEARGGPLNMTAWDPTTRPGPGRKMGPLAPAPRATRAHEGGGGGQVVRTRRAQPEVGGRGGPPSNDSVRPQRTACQQGRGGDSPH